MFLICNEWWLCFNTFFSLFHHCFFNTHTLTASCQKSESGNLLFLLYVAFITPTLLDMFASLKRHLLKKCKFFFLCVIVYTYSIVKERQRATDRDRGNHTPFGPAVAGLALTTAVHARDTVSSWTLINHPFPGTDTKNSKRLSQDISVGFVDNKKKNK